MGDDRNRCFRTNHAALPRVDDRHVVNGIFYILRTGSPWRDLPERYGPYTTVYNRLQPLGQGRRVAGVFSRH